MIRSIGSSLLAKAGTGSLSRKKDETRITKPEVPGKAAVGTAGRDLVQETNITPVAPGSEKVIRSAPGIESASLPGMAANQVPLVAGMGLPPGGMPGKPGAVNPMFQGGNVAPASQEGQAGRQATVASTTGSPLGAVAGAKAERAAEVSRVAQEAAKVQGQRIPFGQGSLPDIGIFGGRVSAEEGEGAPTSQPSADWQPTAGQYASGGLGKLINTIGQKLGNILPEKNVSEKLQSFGGSQGAAKSGTGSIAKAAQNASSALRSVVQQATNTWNKLRSKFGR